jgi:tetratricopeptide (TPR) repeat protein
MGLGGPIVKLGIVFAGLVLSLGAALCFTQTPADKQELATHLQKAQEYLREKQPGLAIPELQAVVTLDPANVDAQGNLGVLLFFQGKLPDAIPHLRAAVEGQNGLAKIQGLLGLAEVRTLDLGQGRRDLETAFPLITDQTFKVQVGLELVTLCTQSGDLDEAANVLSSLRKSAPDNAEVLYAAYRTYSNLSFESLLALSLAAPDSAQMHQLLANEETREGNTNGAIQEFRKAIAIDPRLPGVHFELAELLDTSQEPAIKKEAYHEYLAALAQNPQDEKSICKLGEIAAENGDFKKSLEEFDSAVKLQPGDANAKLGLAKALIELNHADKALPLLEQAVQEEPTNATAHYRLGSLYRQDGRVEDAKREFELYKKLKDMKDKLRAQYKELLIQPAEIQTDEKDEK